MVKVKDMQVKGSGRPFRWSKMEAGFTSTQWHLWIMDQCHSASESVFIGSYARTHTPRGRNSGKSVYWHCPTSDLGFYRKFTSTVTQSIHLIESMTTPIDHVVTRRLWCRPMHTGE